MSLTAPAALIGLGMFVASVAKWCARHWRLVLLKLAAPEGILCAWDGLMFGRSTSLDVWSLVTSRVGFVLLKFVTEARDTVEDNLVAVGKRATKVSRQMSRIL